MREHYRPSTERCPSGFPPLDAVLGGGFVRGAVHEFVAGSAGVAVHSLVLHTAIQATPTGRWIMYIDAAEDFYPPAAKLLGMPLGRLLIIRAHRHADVLWVCEQSLRCRAFGAVVATVRKLDMRLSRRLQLAAEAGAGLGLLLRCNDVGGKTFAATRLRFDPLKGRAEARRMLVTVLKLREGIPGEPFAMEFPDAPGAVPASAIPVDRPVAVRQRHSAG